MSDTLLAVVATLAIAVATTAAVQRRSEAGAPSPVIRFVTVPAAQIEPPASWPRSFEPRTD